MSEEGPEGGLEATDREALLHHSQRLPALDELRALAVLMVFAFHSYVLVENPLAPAWYGALFRSLWSGVDLFFVLSGFLISGILLDTRDQPGMLKTFYLRRTLRIFPLYYATLLLWFVLLRPLWASSGQFQAMEAAQGWFWTYSFNIRAALYGPIPSFFDHFWSLAVEEQFYLIWPLTILLLPKRALPWFLGFGILLGPALRALPLLRSGPEAASIAELAWSRPDLLLMGAALAWLARREGGLNWLRAWRLRLALGASVILLGFLWRDRRLDDHALLFRVFGFSALGLLYTIGLSLVLEPETQGLRGRLGRALRWIGQRSYAIYVFHLPVLVLLFTRAWPRGFEAQVILQHSLLSALALGITLLLASLSWTLLEKPALRLKARFEYEAPAS